MKHGVLPALRHAQYASTILSLRRPNLAPLREHLLFTSAYARHALLDAPSLPEIRTRARTHPVNSLLVITVLRRQVAEQRVFFTESAQDAIVRRERLVRARPVRMGRFDGSRLRTIVGLRVQSWRGKVGGWNRGGSGTPSETLGAWGGCGHVGGVGDGDYLVV